MRRTGGLTGKLRMVHFRYEVARNESACGRHNSDFAGGLGRVVTGVFERLPADLQEQTLLGVHQCGVFGGVAEKGSVEHLDVAKGGGSLYVIGIGDQGWIRTRRQKFLVREERDGLDSIT